MDILLIFLFLFLIIVIFSLFYHVKIHNDAYKLYIIAKKKAKKLNKKLLVLGSPKSISGKLMSNFTKTYGCGDLCIDMNCCIDCKNTICGKVEDTLHKLESNKYIIYESGLLEVVDDNKLHYIVNEIYRLSGGKDNIYSFHHIQNFKFYIKYFWKHIYYLFKEGYIQRFVIKYPPKNKYQFIKI
tara:strand:- start:498 stop:1049 length:552 start_codon:yes stop_codon:yes gene_type:complete